MQSVIGSHYEYLGVSPASSFQNFVMILLHSVILLQAGAKHVYAVEASEMAEYARKLIAGNPLLGQRITVRYFFSFL